MAFVFTKTKIDGLIIVEPAVYPDNRGYFFESYNRADFISAGIEYDFVQDNQSRSKKGVLRGLHFQKQYQQAKLVRVVEGEVMDVAVDLRKGSQTYGQWESVILSEHNKKQLMIPKGFAHGFVVLSDYATFCYKVDDFYHPGDEGGIIWNDPDIAITWPEDMEFVLSEKDKKNPTLSESRVKL